MSGMIGALLVSLVVIGAFVAFRALNRDNLEVKPHAVDCRSSVRFVQDAGQRVVYPSELPSGWICKRARLEPGSDPSWELDTLTAEEKFVGVAQQRASVEELVSKFVDADATEGTPVGLSSPLAPQWRSFTDSGGDYAVAAEIGDQTLL